MLFFLTTMVKLPTTVSPYRVIGPFNQDTVPAGLLREHSTKAGVWGSLEVIQGELTYHITEPGTEVSYQLTPTNPGVIVPEQIHHVTVPRPVEFRITFLKDQ